MGRIRPQQRSETKAIGNLYLDQLLASRPLQPFLQRNLRTIFDSHKHRLDQHGTSSHNMNGGSTGQGRGLETWNKHSQERLQAWIKDSIPAPREHHRLSAVPQSWQTDTRERSKPSTRGHFIIVHTLVIRQLRRAASRSERLIEASSDEPDWLPRPSDDKTRTTCTVSICRDHAGSPENAPISDSRECHLKLIGAEVHVTLRDPLRVQLPHFSWADSSKLPTLWMKVKLEGRSHLLGSLPMVDAPTHDTLAAVQSSQPQYTVSSKLVRVAYSSDTTRGMDKYTLGQLRSKRPSGRPSAAKSLTGSALLDATISVAVTWRDQYVLTPYSRFNDAIQPPFDRGMTQLPTPNSSEDLEYDKTRYKITYVYSKERQLVQRNLHCPLCEKDLGIETFSRLMLHFRTQHIYFDVVAEKDLSNDQHLISQTVQLYLDESVAPKQPIRGKDVVKINWVAPSHPFDENAYVAGETHWDQERAESKAKKVTKAPPLAEPLAAPLSPRLVKPLNVRVPDLHPVPRVLDAQGKQIRFYRTSSKKVLKAGELIAESDEEIDESWLQERQRQTIKRLKVVDRNRQPLLQAEQEFIVDWNNHITQEQRQGSNSDRLKRDSIIRFAQRYRKKLSINAWQKQFAALLDRMVKRRICSERDKRYCLQPDETSSQSSDVVDGGTQSHLTTRSRRTSDDDTEALTEPAMDLCICGERVFSIRGILYCDNAHCQHDAFHMHCFDLKERVAGWKCPDCSSGAVD